MTDCNNISITHLSSVWNRLSSDNSTIAVASTHPSPFAAHSLAPSLPFSSYFLFIFETKCQERGSWRRASVQDYDSGVSLRRVAAVGEEVGRRWEGGGGGVQRERLFLYRPDSLVEISASSLCEIITRFIRQGNNYCTLSTAASVSQRPFNCSVRVF